MVQIEKIVVLIDAPLPTAQTEKLLRLSPKIELVKGLSKENLSRAHIIYTEAPEFDPADAPALRFVQLESASIAHLRHLPLGKSGIPICNARGALAIPVAEFGIALLLNMTRKLSAFNKLQDKSTWPSDDDYSSYLGNDCYGKTCGVLGYGTVGRHLARIAFAMGMKILACQINPEQRADPASFCLPSTGDPEGAMPSHIFDVSELRTMLPQCDVLFITLPLTEATSGLVDKTALAALPDTAFLVNISRGGVVDENALIANLQAGRFSGVAIDVFVDEPLPAEHCFWKMPNVMITPHIASGSIESDDWRAALLIENVSRHLDGKPLVNLVDIERGF